MPPPGSSADPADWYSFLGIGPGATTEQITAAVERLSRQANALAVTAPERARQLRDQARAIKQDLLSGAESRQRYDHGLAARTANDADTQPPGPVLRQAPAGYPMAAPAGPATPRPTASPPGPAIQSGPMPYGYSPPPVVRAPGVQAPGLMSRISKFLQTGWTCVSCGYGTQPTDKFCPKCGNRVESGLGGPQASGSAAGQVRPDAPSREPETLRSRCGQCGTWAAPGDTFCMRCGGGLTPGKSEN